MDELPTLEAMTAIKSAFRTVRVGAAPLLIALERHPAALAILISCFHADAIQNGLILLAALPRFSLAGEA